MANDSAANLFLSIHCNSIAGNNRRKRRVKGYKAFILSPAKNDEDRLVAMKENSVIKFELDEEQALEELEGTEGILWDILTNEFLRESEDWASMIVDQMSKATKKVKRQHTGIGHLLRDGNPVFFQALRVFLSNSPRYHH